MNEKIEKALHIMELALAISTETAHDVFVDYSPHIGTVEVEIFINGWHFYEKPDVAYMCRFDGYFSDNLDDAISELEHLYKHGKLREEAET